jgi:hypothetical protein
MCHARATRRFLASAAALARRPITAVTARARDAAGGPEEREGPPLTRYERYRRQAQRDRDREP